MGDGDWKASYLTDHIVLVGLSLQPEGEYNICLRAVNWADYRSRMVTTKAKVMTMLPDVIGKHIHLFRF